MGIVMLVIGLVLLAVGAALLLFGRRTQAKTNLMQSVATMTASQLPTLLAGEMVEVKGTAQCASPLTAEYANKACVWYSASVVREYEKRERDSKGNMQTNRTSETISSNSQSTPFMVQDATGQVEVNLDGAEIDAPMILDRFEDHKSNSGPSISFHGVSVNVGNDDQTLGYRYQVRALEIAKPVYVLGVYREDGTIGAPPPGSKSRKFIVSHRTEEELRTSWGKQAFWLGTTAVGSFAVGAVLIVLGIVFMIVG